MKPPKNKRIVVTGAAGFIGSCFVRYLNDQGYSNLILSDWLGRDERWKNLVGKEFVDIVKPEELPDWIDEWSKEIHAVVHLGACSDTTEKDADYLLRNNTKESEQLAIATLTNKKRFIYASSAATYGDGKAGFSDAPEKLSTLKPLNMYGYSKHLFDLILLRETGLNAILGLKFFNVFGPNEWHKNRMASTVLHFTRQIQETGEVKLFKSSEPKLYPNGGQMRDFIYVKDVVRILFDLLSSNVTGLYNLGTGKPETWNTLAKSVFAALDLPEKISYIDMPEDLVGKYQNYTAADMTRLKEKVKGLSFTPLKDAVKDYVTNHLIPNEHY